MNFSFWTVVIAATALVLSQLPPIRDWFKRPQLDVEVYRRLGLTHRIGNPNATLHLVLINTGGRIFRVKDLSLRFFRDGNMLFKLPAQNYIPQSATPSMPLIFTPFTLRPGEEWANQVNFLNFFDRAEDRRYRAMESAIRTNIHSKAPAAPEALVEADLQYVEPLMEFFEGKFDWLEGEYRIELSVNADKTSCEKSYRFTIFESQSEDLRGLADHYKYGSGVYWDREDIVRSYGFELSEDDI